MDTSSRIVHKDAKRAHGLYRFDCAKSPHVCCRSYLAQTGLDSWLLADWNAYDQYEVSIPIEEAADCLVKVL